MEKIVITRHPALVSLLLERGLIQEGQYALLEHCSSEQVSGQDVIGVLPLALAAVCRSVTEIPLRLTPEMRGRELDLETIRGIAGAPVTYRVSVVGGVA